MPLKAMSPFKQQTGKHDLADMNGSRKNQQFTVNFATCSYVHMYVHVSMMQNRKNHKTSMTAPSKC